MKKLILLLLLIGGIFGINAQETQQYNVQVGQFNRLRVTDDVNVVYRCLPDSTGWVQWNTTKEFADAFILTPKQGALRIQVATEDVGHPELPTLFVYSDFLTYAENASIGTLIVENPAPCAEFTAKEVGNGSVIVEGLKANVVKASLATGNGTVSVAGTCRDAVYQMVGSGIISADRLEAQNVQCKILGSGTIGCWAVEKLTSKGIGSTKIYYKGDPLIKKAGGGTIYPLPDGRSFDVIITDSVLME